MNRPNIGEIEGNDYSLAIAYVLPQSFENIYDADIGFERGTIFMDLDKPFLGQEGLYNE